VIIKSLSNIDVLIFILIGLYFLKLVFHALYLSKIDKIKNGSNKYTGPIIRYFMIITPVFVKDPIIKSEGKKNLLILELINQIIFILLISIFIVVVGFVIISY